MRIASCHKSLFMEENRLNDSEPIGDSSVHRDIVRVDDQQLILPSASSLKAVRDPWADVAFT